MLRLLIITTLLSFNVFSSVEGSDLTCALKKGERGTNKASIVLTFTYLGSNVYEMHKFTAYSTAKNYRSTSRSGDGRLFRLRPNQDGTSSLGNRITLDESSLELFQNTTTGGYPGAGTPPQRENKFVCLLNYTTDILNISKQQIKADFNL